MPDDAVGGDPYPKGTADRSGSMSMENSLRVPG